MILLEGKDFSFSSDALLLILLSEEVRRVISFRQGDNAVSLLIQTSGPILVR